MRPPKNILLLEKSDALKIAKARELKQYIRIQRFREQSGIITISWIALFIVVTIAFVFEILMLNKNIILREDNSLPFASNYNDLSDALLDNAPNILYSDFDTIVSVNYTGAGSASRNAFADFTLFYDYMGILNTLFLGLCWLGWFISLTENWRKTPKSIDGVTMLPSCGNVCGECMKCEYGDLEVYERIGLMPPKEDGYQVGIDVTASESYLVGKYR